uniref:Uncharacterized protein n=1 Tax=Coniferiporia sulphurascens TaxID=175648 RepID=A0A5B9R9J4_CONSH|nr:hypothetical protein PSUO_000071 [Coniferiporia sulphurascens]QEG57161.1 hypothetical protein PSUO_000071 [Coniferiporia sulphurascens]
MVAMVFKINLSYTPLYYKQTPNKMIFTNLDILTVYVMEHIIIQTNGNLNRKFFIRVKGYHFEDFEFIGNTFKIDIEFEGLLTMTELYERIEEQFEELDLEVKVGVLITSITSLYN